MTDTLVDARYALDAAQQAERIFAYAEDLRIDVVQHSNYTSWLHITARYYADVRIVVWFISGFSAGLATAEQRRP
jgi:hypothetical protein